MRLALIDDHELVREGLCCPARRSGSDGEVVIVYSGASVREAVASSPTVALLDVDLGPGTDPVGVTAALCTRQASTVLLISAFDDAAAVRSGLGREPWGSSPKRVPTRR